MIEWLKCWWDYLGFWGVLGLLIDALIVVMIVGGAAVALSASLPNRR